MVGSSLESQLVWQKQKQKSTKRRDFKLTWYVLLFYELDDRRMKEQKGEEARDGFKD